MKLSWARGVVAPIGGVCVVMAAALAYVPAAGASAPGPSTGLVATAAPGQATLIWTAPADNGGATVTNYAVYTYPPIPAGILVTPDQTPSLVIPGLAADTYYTFTVSAFNGAWGAWSGYSSYVLTPPSSPSNVAFTQSVIDAAVATPPIRIASGDVIPSIYQAKVFFYLALVASLDPSATSSSGTSVSTAFRNQVDSLLAGGNEPATGGGLDGWAHNDLAQGLLLAKSTPAIWSSLSPQIQARSDLFEAAMGYTGNYVYNDASPGTSGVCSTAPVGKDTNPNFRDGYVDVEIAAIQYFGGGGAWDAKLAAFDDATFVGQLRAAGLTNVANCFAGLGTKGNAPIQRPFLYQGLHSSQFLAVYDFLEGFTFDQTAASSVTGVSHGATVTGHIADGTRSPYDGQCCMEHEFDSTDSAGLRTSALYAYEGWMNILSSRATMTTIGTWDCGTPQLQSSFHTGSEDLLYKLHHGYVSYSGSQHALLVSETTPSGDGPGAKGFVFDHDVYEAYIAQRAC